MNCIIRNLLLVFICCLVVGCATQTSPRETSEFKEASPSPAKKAAAEALLKKERFVLSSKAVDGGEYTIYFSPLKGEMRVNLSKNVCFPQPFSARFWVNEADNVAVRVEGLSKKINCPALHFNINPITGVSGEFTYYENVRKWSTNSNRFFLKNE